MFDNFREWLAAGLPSIVQLTGVLFLIIVFAVFVNRTQFQRRKNRRGMQLDEIAGWVKDSIEFYSTHYAHLAAGAFTEDEVLTKLARLAPLRQEAAQLAEKLGDPGLNYALEEFNLVEFHIFRLAGDRSKPDDAAYKEQLAQLRTAGDQIVAHIGLLRG
jgi:hypothetical protein